MKKGTRRLGNRRADAQSTANRFTSEFSGQFRLNPGIILTFFATPSRPPHCHPTHQNTVKQSGTHQNKPRGSPLSIVPTILNGQILILNHAVDPLGSAAASAAVRRASRRTRAWGGTLNGGPVSRARASREAQLTAPEAGALPFQLHGSSHGSTPVVPCRAKS
jgi:hypothetical protein